MTLSDTRVAKLINEEFVPCWESIRPVPKVTINFGDGRTLERTLAGNTVLYVCLPDGRVIDALPGVYTPDDFLKEMGRTLELVNKGEPAPADLAAWHKGQVTQAINSERIRITHSKAIVESPLLRALKLSTRLSAPTAEPQAGAEGQVQPVAQAAKPAPAPDPLADPKAALAAVSARIEDVSKAPATVEQLQAQFANLPEEKRPTPEQLGQMIIQRDSQTNVRLVRPAVHLLFATYERLPQTAECRDAVYQRILHVPIDDPYLGLAEAVVPGTPAGR